MARQLVATDLLRRDHHVVTASRRNDARPWTAVASMAADEVNEARHENELPDPTPNSEWPAHAGRCSAGDRLEAEMITIQIPQDTAFSFDLLGRYTCNTLDEAIDSMNPTLPDQPDARPFDYIVLGGGSFGAVVASRLFNLDRTHAHRILVLEAGPFVLPEHVQNLPPDYSPPGKDKLGTVWGQPWTSDSPMNFNQGFPGLAFCVGGRSVFWGGWSPYLIDSELSDASWPKSVVKDLMTAVLPSINPKESYLDTAARQIGTDTTNDFVSGPLHEAFRDRLFNGLKNRPVAPDKPFLTGN